MREARQQAHAQQLAEQEKRLPAAKRRTIQQREEMEDLTREYQLLKKLKRGKISEHEFDVATGLSSDSDVEPAAKPKHAKGQGLEDPRGQRQALGRKRKHSGDDDEGCSDGDGGGQPSCSNGHTLDAALAGGGVKTAVKAPKSAAGTAPGRNGAADGLKQGTGASAIGLPAQRKKKKKKKQQQSAAPGEP